jgi:tetratricopeptide (TPR) repeat protein
LIRVNTSHFFQNAKYAAVCFLAATAALGAAQTKPIDSTGTAIVQGNVRDAAGKPVVNATVSLAGQNRAQDSRGLDQITHTDLEGRYRFVAVRAGLYSLRAEMPGYSDANVAGVKLAQHKTTKVDLVLGSNKASELPIATTITLAPAKAITQAPEFFDEPRFTVAGVTPATNSGGHGSDTVLRTTEALAKATVSLSNDAATGSDSATSQTEDSLRKELDREPDNINANRQLGKLLLDKGRPADGVPYLQKALRLAPADAELHHSLGKAEEAADNSLDAVREYQRAAELDPSEATLFDWGTELLAHRALEPATEIFTRGNHLYPSSVRMLIALGVSWYARGANDRGARYLVDASDLAPANPEPYEFLGKMQGAEMSSSPPVIERLARFAQLRPDNALANYYYAVALAKQPPESLDGDADNSSHVESLLQKALHLDPKLAAAYLQLGILYSQRADFAQAISAYKNAIEVSGKDDEVLQTAHYRLGQAYLRIGEKTKAQEELQLHDKVSNKTKEDTNRARRQIQEFVISLQNKPAVSHEP